MRPARRTLNISISSQRPTTLVSSHSSIIHLRRLRLRALLILLIVVFAFTYILIARQHTVVVEQPIHQINHSKAVAQEGKRRKHASAQSHTANYPSLHLSQSQELAAVSSFIASLPQNVVPSFVNPLVSIDPELVLDFDTHNARAIEEVNRMAKDVWARNPVFMYCKLYSPISREIKAILDTLRLRPAPTIIDVDTRDDAKVLQPLIHRLTSTKELPVLLVGGKSLGSASNILALHKTGELQRRITEAGAVINGAKRKRRK